MALEVTLIESQRVNIDRDPEFDVYVPIPARLVTPLMVQFEPKEALSKLSYQSVILVPPPVGFEPNGCSLLFDAAASEEN
jgi:hypothetical protein